MTSLLFPDAGSRRADDIAGRPRPNRTVTVWADAAGTVPAEIYANSSGIRGTVVATSTLTTDQYGMLPLFWGPDAGTDRLYVQVAGGPVWPIDAAANERLDTLTGRVADLETGGGQGGLAAHIATVTNVHGIADTAVLETVAGAQAKADAAQGAAEASAAVDATAKAAAAQNAAVGVSAQRAANLADLADVSVARASLGLGAAAVVNIGTAAGTVAAGNDARLIDPRTPTAHAATHAAAGADPVAVTQAQVTGLPAALTAKADLVDGLVPSSQLPDLVINATYTAESEAEMLALPASSGDLAVRIDLDPVEVYILTAADPAILGNWVQLNLAGSVVSVNGQSGAVVLAAADIGAAPTFRTVAAGTGLSGGGDLTANRTLTVVYGATAGTAAQGNDSRIVGAAQASANLADLGSAATARTSLGLGGAATLNVGTTAGTVAAGNDSRLTDARTPTAHAATHAAAGSDPIDIEQSQVGGLTAMLATKADLVGGVLATAQIPALAINETFTVASQFAMLALTAQRGDVAVRTDLTPNRVFVLAADAPGTLANWKEITAAGSVTTVNGQSGVVVLGAADVGAAPTTRTLTAGTGLAGGGTLAADRTFTVAYGTTSGTAAQGNDSRIVNAVAKGSLVFNVKDYGAVGDGVTDDKTAFAACFAAASAVYGQVFLPPGTYAVDGTFPLSGYKCSIIGSGSSYSTGGGAKPVGTVIKAINQTGPVLDFTGFVWPGDYRGRLRFEGFIVQGDNTAGTAKKGIYIPPAQYPIGVAFRDLSITSTGGIGLDFSDMYLSELDAVTVTTPVSAVANNVPYVRMAGCNGLRVSGLGLRSTVFGGTDDVPAAGAWLLEGTAFNLHDTAFYACWLENLHVGDGKAAVVVKANAMCFTDFQVFDTFKVAGAANTAIFRFQPADVLDAGGNIVRGVIPGRGTGATDIDYGVDLLQNNNRVEGVKGYRGNNVRIAAAVTGSYIHLGGQYSTGSVAGVEDNSANSANTYVDEPLGVHRYGANSGNATITFGGVTERVGAGTPEAAVVGNIGDTYRRTDGIPNATRYVKTKFSATNLGWYATVTENFATATISASQSIPFSTNTAWKFTLAGNLTFTAIINPRAGGILTVMLAQDATGSRIVTWPAAVKWAGGAAPTLSTAANAVDTFVLMFDGTFWRELSRAIGT